MSLASSTTESTRRLSWPRVLLALFMVAGMAAIVTLSAQRWLDAQSDNSREPWFAPYVDVTATPTFAFEQMDLSSSQGAILSFIVAQPGENCTPSWGAAYTLEQAGASLDLDRRIARFQQRGGSVAVSFGGLLNDELAVVCTDHQQLKRAYTAVVDRYNLEMIDLDLENNGLTDTAAGARRAQVIAEIQQERRAQGQKLAVWLTLPVIPQGLTEDGTNAVSAFLEAGVDITGINIMTMNYGQSLEEGSSMRDGSVSALIQTHRQLGILYGRAGIYLNSASLWSKMGATPMIGQNDVAGEIFTLEDAKGLNEFVLSRGGGRMSMWSANRDTTCGDNYVNVTVVSDSCSGIPQQKQEFASLLGAHFDGTIALSAGSVTEVDTKIDLDVPDDPATSPYQIWSEAGTYLEGTKVVWKRTVYEAKWWTQGDAPDNPVLDAWQTPWQLVGPVLPGETPVQQATVPAGTYPDWSGNKVYEASDRVLFNGVPYQAKWWNKGQSPAAASSSPDNSPWVPLTQQQINDINRRLN